MLKKLKINKKNKLKNNKLYIYIYIYIYITQTWFIYLINILKALKTVIKSRCCWYTKCGKIDGYSKGRVKWLLR